MTIAELSPREAATYRALCEEWPGLQWVPTIATEYDVTVHTDGHRGTARWAGASPTERDWFVAVARIRGRWHAVIVARGRAFGYDGRTPLQAVRRLRRDLDAARAAVGLA